MRSLQLLNWYPVQDLSFSTPLNNSLVQFVCGLATLIRSRQSQQHFLIVFITVFVSTAGFGPYEPSLGGIYTSQFLGAITLQRTRCSF
jgi:hypothetical protein